MYSDQVTYQGNGGIFPHFTTNAPAETFNYFGTIDQAEALTANQTCHYNEYPTLSPGPNENWEDFNPNIFLLEEKYDSLQYIIDSLSEEYNISTGSTATRLLSQISQLNILLHDLVGNSLQFIADDDSLIFSEWVDRSNPLLKELSKLTYYWYTVNFDKIDSILQSSSNEDAEVFLIATEWLMNKYGRDVNLFQLPQTDLDTLASISNESFGNYTNIVRSFLLNEYDIYIPWPEPLIERGASHENNIEQGNEFSEYKIIPNPSSNCFKITGPFTESRQFTLRIFEMNGRLIQVNNYQLGNEICLSNLPQGIYYLKIITHLDKDAKVLKLFKS